MPYFNKKNAYKLIIISFLIILTMILRLPFLNKESSYLSLSNGLIYVLIYFGLFISWGTSLTRRISQEQILKYLMKIVYLIIFWFIVRTFRHIYSQENINIKRWLWYSYYIPMLLIPLMIIFVFLGLGKEEDYKLPKGIRLIYIPTLILLGLVLSNDLHQLIFKFTDPYIWTSNNYNYGQLYWLVWLWIILSILIALVVTISKSIVPHSKRILYLPLLPYLGALIYSILYIKRYPLLRLVAGDMTAIFSLFTIIFLESFIHNGIIPSNIYYEELFYNSNFKARIFNKDNELCYETRLVNLDDKNDVRESSYLIPGGWVVWLEDISEINKLIKKLEKINQTLSEENLLLQAELELEERKVEAEEKTRLYNKIVKEVEPEIQLLTDVVSDNFQDSTSIQDKLLVCSVLGTYIKRQSNLLILEEDRYIVLAKEFEYSLRESIEAISQGEIMASLKSDCQGTIRARNLILVYGLFQSIVGFFLSSLIALFVNLKIKEGETNLKLQIDVDSIDDIGRKIQKEEFKNYKLLKERAGCLEFKKEDEVFFFTINLPGLGGVL